MSKTGWKEDTRELQEDLHHLSEWTKNWQLTFNSDKSKVMHIGCNQGAKYYIKRKEIQSTKEEKDLGVWVTSNLKSSLHASVERQQQRQDEKQEWPEEIAKD